MSYNWKEIPYCSHYYFVLNNWDNDIQLVYVKNDIEEENGIIFMLDDEGVDLIIDNDIICQEVRLLKESKRIEYYNGINRYIDLNK